MKYLTLMLILISKYFIFLKVLINNINLKKKK